MKTVALFNTKSGVGKTSLVYHLAYMFAERGVRVIAVDLDPQANLSSMFVEEERMEVLWGSEDRQTVYTPSSPSWREPEMSSRRNSRSSPRVWVLLLVI